MLILIPLTCIILHVLDKPNTKYYTVQHKILNLTS